MDYLSSHREVLEQAVAGTLPEHIDQGSAIPVGVVRDLVEEGLIEAVDVSTYDGIGFLEPRITIAGREYLNELNNRVLASSPAGKIRSIGLRLLDWSGGVVAGIIIAWASTKLL